MTEADLIEVSTQTIWAIIKCSASFAACIPDCRIDHQYFSDGNFDTGADAYLCAKTFGDIYYPFADRKLDHAKLCRVFYHIM